MQQHFYRSVSVIAMLTITVLIISSCGSNKFNCYSFNTGFVKVDNPAYKDDFLEKNDGTHISVKGDLSWKSGLLYKDELMVNNVKYKIADIKGYQENGTYFLRRKKEYVGRMLHGRINLYYSKATVYDRATYREECSFYSQIGDDGPLKQFYTYDAVRAMVKDCPAAYEMMHYHNRQISRLIYKDMSYLQKVVDTYNHCK